ITYTKGLCASKYENRSGVMNKSVTSDEQTIREAPVPEVCETFKVARGMVQSLITRKCWKRLWSWLTFHMLRKLIPQHKVIIVTCHFVDVSKFLVNTPEITIIFIISFVRTLYKAGLRPPQAIAEASNPEIGKALTESSSWTAQEGHKDACNRELQRKSRMVRTKL
ncbi:hypothetical protein NC653_017653, partial [Populus alba x Populus x berolinensis]